MRKILLIVLVLIISFGVLTGCSTHTDSEKPESNIKVISPLPETLDIKVLDNCTVAVSLEKEDIKVDENKKYNMNVKVYSYDIYDMVDIASLNENDIIIRKNEEIKISEIERLESGLVRINGGEENGGFDLVSNNSTVYYEIGMNDIKAYQELGEISLPVSDEFEYIDESKPGEVVIYHAEDFGTDNSDIEYNFSPNDTCVVIENGTIIKMIKSYMP